MRNIANLLDYPTSVVKFNIHDYAFSIECALDGMLIDPPKGIYIIGELEPVIRDNLEYYTAAPGENYVVIDDINTVTSHVYNNLYKIIIPRYMMNDKDRYLSNHPTLPYIGVNIVDSLISDHISSCLSYNDSSLYRINHFNRDITCILSKYILEKYRSVPSIMEDIVDKCSRVCIKMLNNIEVFMFDHEWYIYQSYVNNSTLVIERYCDWRVYEWYRLQERDICD
jgi:hypothetical protein